MDIALSVLRFTPYDYRFWHLQAFLFYVKPNIMYICGTLYLNYHKLIYFSKHHQIAHHWKVMTSSIAEALRKWFSSFLLFFSGVALVWSPTRTTTRLSRLEWLREITLSTFDNYKGVVWDLFTRSTLFLTTVNGKYILLINRHAKMWHNMLYPCYTLTFRVVCFNKWMGDVNSTDACNIDKNQLRKKDVSSKGTYYTGNVCDFGDLFCPDMFTRSTIKT